MPSREGIHVPRREQRVIRWCAGWVVRRVAHGGRDSQLEGYRGMRRRPSAVSSSFTSPRRGRGQRQSPDVVRKGKARPPDSANGSSVIVFPGVESFIFTEECGV